MFIGNVFKSDCIGTCFSRNQLSVLPAKLCKLPLQVLLVNHNRLVSLPEEISQLTALLELDASCNQLSRLPVQTGDLQQLQVLNLRKNFLVELPKGAPPFPLLDKCHEPFETVTTSTSFALGAQS